MKNGTALMRDVVAKSVRVMPPPADGVVLTRASDIKITGIRWLWRDWLARGKFHILAGAPGQGKTTIAMALAATVSVGGRWPDGTTCTPANVLIWSGEDDPSDTLAPRLLASGADLNRCYFVTGCRRDGEIEPFDPARDLLALQAQLDAIGGAALLIVDPVVTAVTGDSHKNTETRRSLQPLVDLGMRYDCAILGITHFSKAGQGGDPAQRVVGSVAFTALARMVLVAARVADEEGEEKRIFARAKSNIAPDSGGFQYHLEQYQVKDGIEASRCMWGQLVKGSASELLRVPDDAEKLEADTTNDAMEILRAELTSDCWTPQAVAKKPLADMGLSKKQIWNIGQKLGVISRKGGFQGFWYWRLPGGDDPPMPDAKYQNEQSEPPEDS